MPNRLTTAVDNVTALTASVWNNEFDNIWSGTLSRTGGSLTHNDDIASYYGTSNDAVIYFNTTQTQDALVIGVDTTSRTIIVCDNGDEATNFALAARSDPTIIVHSATAATNDYIEYSSNQIRFHDTDVAHGMTTNTDTDVYAMMQVASTDGGLLLDAFGDSTAALHLRGFSNTDNTTHTTAGRAPVELWALKRSGTAGGDVGADGNLVVIRNGLTTTRFCFDAEGSAHADVEWIAFDDYDDIALITDFERGITQGFGEFLTYNREAIERAGIAHFDDQPGHAMVNFTRLSMLLCGALRQTTNRIAALEARLLEA